MSLDYANIEAYPSNVNFIAVADPAIWMHAIEEQIFRVLILV